MEVRSLQSVTLNVFLKLIIISEWLLQIEARGFGGGRGSGWGSKTSSGGASTFSTSGSGTSSRVRSSSQGKKGNVWITFGILVGIFFIFGVIKALYWLKGRYDDYVYQREHPTDLGFFGDLARDEVLADCQQQQPMTFHPRDGEYKFTFFIHNQRRETTCFLQFTPSCHAKGWIIMGYGRAGPFRKFDILEGRLSPKGTAYWVEHGQSVVYKVSSWASSPSTKDLDKSACSGACERIPFTGVRYYDARNSQVQMSDLRWIEFVRQCPIASDFSRAWEEARRKVMMDKSCVANKTTFHPRDSTYKSEYMEFGRIFQATFVLQFSKCTASDLTNFNVEDPKLDAREDTNSCYCKVSGHGHDEDGSFEIADGLVSSSGATFWVDECKFGRTLSQGHFSADGMQFRGSWISQNKTKGEYEIFTRQSKEAERALSEADNDNLFCDELQDADSHHEHDEETGLPLRYQLHYE